MSENLKIAQELGIENAESLTAAQLKKAIATAQGNTERLTALQTTAVELGLPFEGLTADELADSVEFALEEKLKKDMVAQTAVASDEVLGILSEYLGVPDIRTLSFEEVQAKLNEKNTAVASDIEVVLAEEGRSEESFVAENGKAYVFTPDAPAAFRCLGVAKTQKEWLEDTESMELLVAGNLSFLTLKK